MKTEQISTIMMMGANCVVTRIDGEEYCIYDGSKVYTLFMDINIVYIAVLSSRTNGLNYLPISIEEYNFIHKQALSKGRIYNSMTEKEVTRMHSSVIIEDNCVITDIDNVAHECLEQDKLVIYDIIPEGLKVILLDINARYSVKFTISMHEYNRLISSDLIKIVNTTK